MGTQRNQRMNRKEFESELTGKAFFESYERSRQIRDACIKIFKIWEYLLECPNPEKADYQIIQSRLAECERMLLTLNIRIDMQTGRPAQDYATKPIVAAEYLAGQVFDFITLPIPNLSDAKAVAGEFGGKFLKTAKEEPAETMDVYLKSTQTFVREFMRSRQALVTLKGWFFVTEDEMNP